MHCTYIHAFTYFRAMEYLLVPDSLSLTKKLASLQRCSWASACCRLTLPWYQLEEVGERGGREGDESRESRSLSYSTVTCSHQSSVKRMIHKKGKNRGKWRTKVSCNLLSAWLTVYSLADKGDNHKCRCNKRVKWLWQHKWLCSVFRSIVLLTVAAGKRPI